MNWPNLLTCSRLIFAAFFIYFLFEAGPMTKTFALASFVLASLTDYWDGRVARARGEITVFGKWMDPIADKILVLAAFFGFAFLGLVPMALVFIVFARDLVMTGFRFMVSKKSDVSAATPGKQKTVFHIVYIILVLLYLVASEMPWWDAGWTAPALALIRFGMIAVVAITLWSAFHYFSSVRKLK